MFSVLLNEGMSFSSTLSLNLIGQGFAGDMEGNGATLCTEVTKLTTALQEYQDMVQVRYLHEEGI